MNKFKIFLILFFWGHIAVAMHYEDGEDLQHFLEYNRCEGCNLSHSLLQHSKHAHAVLNRSDLSQANLSHANFVAAQCASTVLLRAKLVQAKFMNANFDNAHLVHINAFKASFSGATFRNALLDHANFNHALLSRVDFTGATLREADLSYAILIGSNLSQEQLQQVKKAGCAVLPDGTLYNPEHLICNYG